MSKENNHAEFLDLIPKYLGGEASDPEVKQLEAWVLSSDENRKLFGRFKRAWILTGIEGNPQNIDVEKEWKATADLLFPKDNIVDLKARPKRRSGIILRIAAAIALLVAASVWFFIINDPVDYHEVASQNAVEEEALPDGTEIALNQFSSVKFSSDPKARVRRVELKGDAFFEVEKDAERPFIISAQDVEIEVLGTSFYVDSREDQPQIQVIVNSGLVSMKAGSDQVVLSANEAGIYEKSTGQLLKKQNDDVNYMAWKTKLLVFENTDLERVVFDLNRRFHSRVLIGNPGLNSCKITATFDHKSLEATVRIIEKTLNIKAREEGDTIVFSGDSCD